MPAATPFPRGPSVLTLYHAEDLLTAAGCPACRYVAEASDRYLAWFALEGHGDAVTITRLCASLGMCPQHTRGLMRQPGAAIRLTAVYRYLLQSARAQLTGRAASLAPCPACARETAARDRALDTLVTGLGGDEIRGLYRELGGLCVPHVRAAAGLRARRQVIGWLTESMNFRLAGEPPSLAVLAGWPDADAGPRARLRASVPARGAADPDICPVCLAAARAERDGLARLAAGPVDGRVGRAGLCPAHVHDACAAASGDQARAGMTALLAGQAQWSAACLARMLSALTSRAAVQPARRLPRSALRAWGPGDCPVCCARDEAAQQETGRCRRELMSAAAERALHHRPGLCIRHVLTVRSADAVAGRKAAGVAAGRAARLIDELGEASRKATWAGRHEARGPEMTAWRRAAALLDGGVHGGGPAGAR